MAKKKKTALSAINRGFATTSTPSKKPDQSNPGSGHSTAGTSTPNDEEKRNIAQAISEIIIEGNVQDDDDEEEQSKSGDTAFDPEKEAEQALQNLVDRLREKVDKEVARVWKNIEFDRRQSRQLPIFEMDSELQDEVITLYNTKSVSIKDDREEADLSALLEQVSPSSAAADLFQKALVTHFLLLRLGFSFQQAISAISNCQTVTDIDDCVAWLASNLSTAELEAADRKVEGKPPLKKHNGAGKVNGSEIKEGDDDDDDDDDDEEEVDTTQPPVHDGFTFERQANVQSARKNGTPLSSSLPPSVVATPLELSPEIETQITSTINFAKATLRSLDDRDVIDALEDPVQSYARARLYVIETERASVKLEKVAKGIVEGSSSPLDEARRALIRVKTQARGIIDDCQDSRDWNRTLADRLFLKLKVEAEDQQLMEDSLTKESAPAINGNKKEDLPDNLDQGSQASSDEEGLFGDMLDEHPQEVTDVSTQTVVRLRELAPEALKAGGSKSPKVLLSDALRRADPYATSRFDPVATGGRMFRSRLTLRWSINKSESVIDVYTMTTIATGSQSSADDIVAVAALMCIEARPVYKTLASGWRDWWNELEGKRQEERDRRSRSAFKRVLQALQDRLLEENIKAEEKRNRLKAFPGKAAVQEDNADHKSVSMPSLERAPDQNAIHSWEVRRASPGYQTMLPGRHNLPIYAFQQHILETLSQNQVFVLSGETGCGKSTQVPAYILEECLSNGMPCKIYVTEPRRISAISLAERVSSELGEARGAVGKSDSLIGSAVRLESNIGRSARLVYATTGIVLRMLEGSRLEGVTHVILDEVHERSIESDFLLIILKSLLEARPDLKVILMSATLDAKRISDYFGGCPTVNVPGRTFPVDVRWLEDAVELCDYTLEDGSPYARRPKRGQTIKGNQGRLQTASNDDDLANDDDDDDEEENRDEGSNINVARYRPKTIETLDRMDEYTVNHELIISLLERMCFGDQTLVSYSAAILVFLPGIAEIRKLNDLLQVHPAFGSNRFQLFPLHSTISSENQSLVFHLPPNGVRKIVLSTNIAETGITIPDITCVIDTGKHREMRFDEKRQMSKLIECFVAKSNAKQRRGRAGRVQNGLCWHLFTRHRHDQYLAEHPLPEMLRLSLQDLALKLKVMKIQIGTTIEDALSKALDPPTAQNIQRSVTSLVEIKALTNTEEITPLGRHLAKIPLDVHMGKFLLIACSLQILDSALTIAATLNSKSPFLNPFGRELEARNAKKSFDFGDNDFLTIVKAFNSWRRATENGLGKRLCDKFFLSQNNFIQIEELRQQYMTYLLDSGFVSVDDETRREIVGARFRFNASKTKFLSVPANLDANSGSLAMINSALVSSLYPKLLVIDSKTAGLRTLTNGAPASIHPSSVNFKMKLYHLPKGVNHLVYFTIMQSRRLYAWETGVVDDKAILMMCGDADFKFASGSLYLDRTRLRLTVYGLKTLVALKVLREKMAKLLNTSFKNPSKPWSEEEESFFLLACRVLGVGASDKDRALS